MRHFEKTMALILAAACLVRLTTGCASGGFGERPKLENFTHDGGDWNDKVTFSFDISDADGTKSHVVMKYSDDGGTTWKPARLVYASKGAPSGNVVRKLWPKEAPNLVTVRWDTWTDDDKVAAGGPVLVRVKLSSYDVDGAGNEIELPAPITVDNLHPILEVDKQEVVFTDGVLGLQDPTDQTLTVTNAGAAGCADLLCTLIVEYHEALFPDWLTVPSPVGPIMDGNFDVVTLSADCLTDSLPRGEYHATVTIEDTNAHESPMEIPVRLVVRDQMAGIYLHDGFDVQVTDLAFEYANSVLTPDPDPAIFSVKNSGEIATFLDWQLSDDTGSAAWLSYPLVTSGTNLGSGLSEQVEVTITDPGSMDPGRHTATITVTGRESATGDPTYTGNQTVTVTLDVDFPPIIVFGPSSFTGARAFEGVYGSVDPDPKTLYISNSGDRTLNWIVSDDAAWLTLSPLSDSCTSETDQVQVSVQITGVAARTYTATITITDGNTQKLIPVTLIIYPD